MPFLYIAPLITIVVFVGFSIWYFVDRWYVRKYLTTHEATDKYAEGWSKCCVCGAAPGVMYRTSGKWFYLFNRFRCSDCLGHN